MASAVEDAEHRLAVLTSWGLFGAFGMAIVTAGFAADALLVALAGYGVLAVGFVAHIVLNWIYRTGFRNGEIAGAIGVYGLAAVVFLANWLFNDAFTEADVYAGLTGLAVTVAGFLGYLVTRYGLTGSFSMFHIQRS